MKRKNSTYTNLLAFFALLVIINMLAVRFFVRIDLTEDERYTLSDATKTILKDLDEPVTITAYFTKDIPQEIAQVRNEFQDLLTEYASRSHGMVAFEFLDPNKDQEIERKAQSSGIKPIMITKNEKDQSVQQKAYLGAVVQMGTEKEVIPLIQSGSAMEYALSTSIKKMAVKDKPVIAFIIGNGEPTRASIIQVEQSLSILYNVAYVTLNDTINLNQYKAVAIINPKDSIPTEQLQILDEYMDNGGHLFVAFNRVDLDQQQAMGKEEGTGLENWLKQKGMLVSPEFITDARCGAVQVPQRVGFMTINTQVSFPYFPIISNYADHPITAGLGPIGFQFASPIEFVGDTTQKFTPLLLTSEKSNSVPTPMYLNLEKKWTNADFNQKAIPVAALLEGTSKKGFPYKLIAVADGDFPLNGSGQNQRRIDDNNVNLVVNSIDWMSDDSGLIDLRNKGITARLLDEIDDSTRVWLKWGNFLFPLLVTLLIGLFMSQRNRTIRRKRKEGSYV